MQTDLGKRCLETQDQEEVDLKMETFAAKVQYGIGSRFDPMMEERGIWTTTAPQHRDVDMPKAVIKEFATANNQISKR